MGIAPIKVVGIKEFRKFAKETDDKSITDGLKDVNESVANVIILAARANAFTPMLSKAMATLTPGRQAARAVITGGKGIDFFFGSEFGAVQNAPRQDVGRGPGPGYNQFQPFRGSGAGAGYAFFPALRDKVEEAKEMYMDGMTELFKPGFPD